MNSTRKCYGCKRTTLKRIAEYHWFSISKWMFWKWHMTKWLCPDCFYSTDKFDKVLDKFYGISSKL